MESILERKRPSERLAKTGSVADTEKLIASFMRTARTGTGDSPAQAPLLLENVWRGYRSKAGAVEVLRGVDMHVSAGELVIVAGPSGSGKSTLLSVMGGMLRAERGKVLVTGQDLARLPERKVGDVRRRCLGFIFQKMYLLPALTAEENIRVVQEIKACAKVEKGSARSLLGLVGMAEYAKRKPDALSGGQCQRVAVARALAGNPKIILADEPTASLDTANAMSVMDLLKDLTLRKGLATVVVTHDTRLFRFADRVLSLDGGQLKEARGR